MSSQNKRKIGGVDDEYTDVTTTPKRAKTAKSGPSKRRAEAFEEETEEERNASPPQSIAVERPPPPLFALVIGIDKYFSDRIRDLSGAVADADAVDAFLQETLRIPKHQIKNLRNEEATRLTIETEIKDLGNNPAIKKDDPILIFYAGHGAEAKATLGWSSANGKIQMLVPYDFIPSGSDDSERGQGVLDMRLSYLLTDLAAKKSDNITVILDCCHSGSGTRTDDDDPTFAVRGIDLPEAYTVAQDLLHDIADARASVVATGFEKSAVVQAKVYISQYLP
ncbi:uncharacterized protein ARMOST_09789 [Armillaria ostoyae]|uniref:Peptidase C14 caspase domain-containing protein n=1 Tax=Armillaria ostoyae TaxID=47428 RepID=A0A284RCH5_ARMOS|nr:uncharacterized protein ARMOST_09789 [Armillaria ostoyae]